MAIMSVQQRSSGLAIAGSPGLRDRAA